MSELKHSIVQLERDEEPGMTGEQTSSKSAPSFSKEDEKVLLFQENTIAGWLW